MWMNDYFYFDVLMYSNKTTPLYRTRWFIYVYDIILLLFLHFCCSMSGNQEKKFSYEFLWEGDKNWYAYGFLFKLVLVAAFFFYETSTASGTNIRVDCLPLFLKYLSVFKCVFVSCALDLFDIFFFFGERHMYAWFCVGVFVHSTNTFHSYVYGENIPIWDHRVEARKKCSVYRHHIKHNLNEYFMHFNRLDNL